MNIKIDPKTALEIIDRRIVSGYEKKDTIGEDFRKNGDPVTNELVDKWNKIRLDWINETLEELGTIFTSETPLYNFRDAHPPFGTTSLDVRYSVIPKDFDAKLRKLNEYLEFIQVNFNVKPVQVTVSGHQSRVNINSTDNSTNTIDQSIKNDIEQLERIISEKYSKKDKDEILRQIQEIKELAEDPKSNQEEIRSKLGTILSRTAEIATVASLIAKVLTSLTF